MRLIMYFLYYNSMEIDDDMDIDEDLNQEQVIMQPNPNILNSVPLIPNVPAHLNPPQFNGPFNPLLPGLPRSNISSLISTSASLVSNSSNPGLNYASQLPLFNSRQNFLNHYDLIIYSSSIKLDNDEEFVIKPVEEIKEISSEPVSVKMTPMINKLKLGNDPVDLVCTLSLLGLSAELEVIEKNREGLDLVFVVDISGSMGSGKIDLVKVTIQFVLTILKDFDRVSIIGFSDQAYIFCPLTVMNEEGKLKVERIVQDLGPTGGTHIESGVRAALHLLADRRMVNQLTAIMLLSDGCDNDTQTVNERIRQAINEFKPKIQENFKMHTFGYGTDHDSVIMNLMAELTRGNFYYIESLTSVTDAFSNCMGELVSLVANKIRVNLTTLPCQIPFKLTKVFSSNEDTSFDMPDLFFDDQQDAVFILQFVPTEAKISGKIIPIKALVSYTLKGGIETSKEVFLEIELASPDEELTENKEVQLEYFRVRGAEVLKQMTNKADSGLMTEAQKLGSDFQVELEGCGVKSHQKIQFLLKDIVDAQNRTKNTYSWSSGGRAQVTSVMNTHCNKISSNNCVSYQKPMQAMYSLNSNVYAQSLPVQRLNNNANVSLQQPNIGIGPGLKTQSVNSLPSAPYPQPYPGNQMPMFSAPPQQVIPGMNMYPGQQYSPYLQQPNYPGFPIPPPNQAYPNIPPK